MIIACTSCKTRFRVSADKIGPNGARVRCSRCGTVFVVSSSAISPGARGDVVSDPPAIPRHDPFDPLDSGPLDPVAPAASASAGAVPPSSGTLRDPFASLPAAAKPEDPFGRDADWDPFGVSEPGPGPAPQHPAPPAPASSRVDLTELIDDREQPRARPDPAPLALEESAGPPPRTAPTTYDGSDLDFGFGTPGAPGILRSGDPFEPIEAMSSEPASPDREPPRIDERTGSTPSPPPHPGDELPVGPQQGVIPAAAPAPAVESPAPSTPAGARSGRLAAALTNSLSLALLIAVAAALFLGWRIGLVGRLRGALTRGTPAPLVEASGVTGGLYDTAAGAQVLVVRGQIEARAAVRGPVQVRVDLVAGERVVATAMGLAGAAATAEQVYGAGTAQEAAALRRDLDDRAARALDAGSGAPFLVVFPAPAPDPQGLRLRVAAEPAPATALGGG